LQLPDNWDPAFLTCPRDDESKATEAIPSRQPSYPKREVYSKASKHYPGWPNQVTSFGGATSTEVTGLWWLVWSVGPGRVTKFVVNALTPFRL
jgi:hypothetical protein